MQSVEKFKEKNMIKKFTSFILVLMYMLAPVGAVVYAQSYTADDLLPEARIFITPQSGSFSAGSTFQSSIYIDTKGNNINAVDLYVNFDPTKLSLVSPSNGKSFFGVWLGSPKYDNSAGTVSMSGVNTEGIKTSSGLIVTMTFKALQPGTASIWINDKTAVYLTDGYGSEIVVSKGKAVYTLTEAPAQVMASTDSNPAADDLAYNDNIPIIVVGSQSRTASMILFAVLFLLLLELILYYLFRRHIFQILKHGYTTAKNIRFEDPANIPVKTASKLDSFIPPIAHMAPTAPITSTSAPQNQPSQHHNPQQQPYNNQHGYHHNHNSNQHSHIKHL